MAQIQTYPRKTTYDANDLILVCDKTPDENSVITNETKTITLSTISDNLDVVDSLNSLKGNVSITAGSNISISTVGNNVEISSLSGGMGGSGTVNYIPKFSASSTLANSIIFNSGDNVGIGTTSPGARLEINGGTGSDATIIASGTRPVTITGAAVGKVEIKGSNGGWSTGYFFTGNSGTARGGFGALGSVDDITYFWIGDDYNDTTMVIQGNAGNVGLGTTSPAKKLTVRDGADTKVTALGSLSNDPVFFASDSSGNLDRILMRQVSSDAVYIGDIDDNNGDLVGRAGGVSEFIVKNGGNIGMGVNVASVDAKLDIINTATQPSIRVTDNTYNNYLIQKRRTDNSQILGIQEFGSNGGLSLVTGGSQRLNVNNLGSVGIGTTSPAEKLEVTGKIKATGTADVLQLYRNSSSQANYIKFYDNATSSPEFYLGFTSSDRDFQIYNLASSGTVALRSGGGGNKVIMLDSSGNVGIGTTSPSEKLDVSGTVNLTNLKVSGTQGTAGQVLTSSGSGISWSSLGGNVTGSGNQYDVAIFSGSGSSSAISGGSPFKTNGSNQAIIDQEIFGGITFRNGTGAAVTINSKNSSGASYQINLPTGPSSGGQVLKLPATLGSSPYQLEWSEPGTTTPSAITGTTSVNASNFAAIPYTFENTSGVSGVNAPLATQVSSSAGAKHISFYYEDDIVGSISQNGTSAVAFNTSSDYRLKENVVDMTGSIDRLKQLKPSRFNFIADGPSRTVDGFLAHEVSSIVPEAVTGTKDAVDADNNIIPQGIDQSKLVPLLVGAIKELTARIEALEA
tara:strand:- start:44 stop:2431 length:2388 start_codon:yes stop_codon:yes gene_type:complete